MNPDIIEKLYAGAFRNLLEHLQERSDIVSNIDLMTISGFCRNCLAKWMVLEARRLVDTNDPILQNNNNNDTTGMTTEILLINQLNQWTYDDAAKIVYGTSYEEWKQQYQTKKATVEQIDKYNASIPIHSQFNKDLLQPRDEPVVVILPVATSSSSSSPTTIVSTSTTEQNVQQEQQSSSTNDTTTIISTNSINNTKQPVLLSNVCCENVDNNTTINPIPNKKELVASSSDVSSLLYKNQQPQVPSITDIIKNQPQILQQNQPIHIGIITISDRAYRNEYPLGDQSGPAIQQSINNIIITSSSNALETTLKLTYTTRLVPDDIVAIQNVIKELLYNEIKCDIILTTGGTGVSVRDVTPEATRSLESFVECTGLMNYILNITTQYYEPYSVLSRGIAGILHNTTFIANLPGNPKSIHEIIPYLFPLALSAITDLRS